MVEKTKIVNELRFQYEGPIAVEKFYAEVEDWISEKGMYKDIKIKREHVLKSGKQLEWAIEIWKAFDDAHKEVVTLRVLFDKVRNLKIKRNNRTLQTQHADMMVVIEGFLETSLTFRWTQAPLFVFFRHMYHKYIWMIEDPFEGPLTNDCYDLHKRLKNFLNLGKMRIA